MMKKVVIAIPVKNCAIYLEWLIRQIQGLDYPRDHISIAFLENDSDDNSWEVIQKIVKGLDSEEYRQVNAEQFHTGFKLPHTSRHLPSVQRERLQSLYTIRQRLVDQFLRDNDYLWYVDADCIMIPNYALKEMLRSGGEIVVPILHYPDMKLYDFTTVKLVNGSYLKVDELMKIYPGEDFIEVDLANAPFMAARAVFEKVRYEGCLDDQEGPCFCRNAAKCGIKPVAAVNVKILHAAVVGNRKM